jgi:hypothetical protein
VKKDYLNIKVVARDLRARVCFDVPISVGNSDEEKSVKKLAIALSFCATAAFAGSWTGTISDSKCGAAHADGSEKSVKCAQGCVKSGKAQPVLVSEGKVYKLSDASKATDHVGHKVTVTGDLDGDTIKVDAVKMAE